MYKSSCIAKLSIGQYFSFKLLIFDTVLGLTENSAIEIMGIYTCTLGVGGRWGEAL